MQPVQHQAGRLEFANFAFQRGHDVFQFEKRRCLRWDCASKRHDSVKPIIVEIRHNSQRLKDLSRAAGLNLWPFLPQRFPGSGCLLGKARGGRRISATMAALGAPQSMNGG